MSVGSLRPLAWPVAIAASFFLVPSIHGREATRARSAPRYASGTVLEATPSFVKVPSAGVPVWITHVNEETSSQIMQRNARAPQVPFPSLPVRELPYPDRSGLPQNPNSPQTATQSHATDAEEASSIKSEQLRRAPFFAQTFGTSFTAATLSGLNPVSAFPPDSMGAVGPTQYVVAVNNRIVTFSKGGVADGVLNATTDTFFASVRNESRTSDPRIRYDRLSARWFIVMINISNPNRVLIAWSDGASAGAISASTVWSFAYFDELAGASCLEDFPTLGVDNNALYIGTNTFCGTPGSEIFAGSSGYVLPKASLLAGNGSVIRFALVPTASAAGPYTPQGVDNYDPSSIEGYFIGVDNTQFGTLVVRRVSTPGGTPTISGNINITVPTTWYPSPIPHLGNTGGTIGNLDAVDDRLSGAHIRNGRLWTAHNIEVTSAGVATGFGPPTGRVGVRWYELNGIRTVDVGTPTVVQSGTLFDSVPDGTTARNFWMPSIMVSGQLHAALGFSTAGTNFRADAATAGRWSGDTLGTLQLFSLFTSSATAYNPPNDPGIDGYRRWGDYSYTSLDPLDDMTIWTIQEFCDATNSYGVRVAKLTAPPPATPSSLSPSSILVGLTSTIVTVTGVTTAGSGFFDPGTNLGSPARLYSHISASVNDGVIVNGAAYVSPTVVTLDLNTTNATPGAASITIVNPDGQVATGTGILTVNLGTPIVVATATSASSVTVNWNSVSGATSYEVYRSVGIGNAFTLIGNTSVTSFIDSGRTPDTTYLYEVRALAGAGPTGPFSALDLATTTIFIDDPLITNTTIINGSHIEQLRTAVNAVRAAAGLGPYAFTDAGAMTGVPIRAVHITDLRSALNAGRLLLSVPAVTYANSATAGTMVRALDLAEVRDGTR